MEDTDIFVDAETRPICERYRRVNIGTSVVFYSVIGLTVLGIARQPFLHLPEPLLKAEWLVYFAIAVIALWSIVYHWLADPKIRYIARVNDVVLHKGLIFRSIICQPVKRIQHVEIKQGPIERHFKLANLNIYSAGGIAHTFSIPGLTLNTAQTLREFILSHKDINTDQ